MKDRLPCEMVQDILPSYVDGLTSEVTNQLIEEHMEDCNNCRQVCRRMQEPDTREIDEDNQAEIDYLKKTKKRIHNVMVGSILMAILVMSLVLLARTYLIGEHAYSTSAAYEVEVEGNQLRISGVTADERIGVSGVECEENNGIVTISLRTVRSSLLYGREFEAEYSAEEDIQEVRVGTRILWAKALQISALTSAVYNSAHEYVGDMSANGRTAQALNMTSYIGNFTNELQTTEEPYGWTLILEDDVQLTSKKRVESLMESYAYILLSVIGNLGEVTYDYTVDGQNESMTITTLDAASFAGMDIKNCGQDVALLQQLVEKIGLDSYAYVAGEYYGTESELTVEIVNNTSEDLPGISVSYLRDGEVCGTQGSRMTDNSKIKKGETMAYTFMPEDFGLQTWDSDADMEIQVSVADEQGNLYGVATPLHIASENMYQFSLSGNATDGYTINQ